MPISLMMYQTLKRSDCYSTFDTPTAKAVGFFSAKPYASISSLYLPKAKGMPIPHPSSEHIVN